MKLFLDCEFTQLNQSAKLISLALVSEAGHEYYVELIDTYQVEDCSDFVIDTVLPQLDLDRHGVSLQVAQGLLRTFLNNFDETLEVCSDGPERDWGFFCLLADRDHRWPRHVLSRPTNLIEMFAHLEADDIDDAALPEPPHHSLLDARLLAKLYASLTVRRAEAPATASEHNGSKDEGSRYEK